MSNHEYLVSVRSDHPIPPDVLIEHMAVALRDFKETPGLEISMHPFDDKTNVLFDDKVQTEEYSGPNAEPTAGELLIAYVAAEKAQADKLDGAPADPFPLVTRVLDKLKGHSRG